MQNGRGPGEPSQLPAVLIASPKSSRSLPGSSVRSAARSSPRSTRRRAPDITSMRRPPARTSMTRSPPWSELSTDSAASSAASIARRGASRTMRRRRLRAAVRSDSPAERSAPAQAGRRTPGRAPRAARCGAAGAASIGACASPYAASRSPRGTSARRTVAASDRRASRDAATAAPQSRKDRAGTGCEEHGALRWRGCSCRLEAGGWGLCGRKSRAVCSSSGAVKVDRAWARTWQCVTYSLQPTAYSLRARVASTSHRLPCRNTR